MLVISCLHSEVILALSNVVTLSFSQCAIVTVDLSNGNFMVGWETKHNRSAQVTQMKIVEMFHE